MPPPVVCIPLARISACFGLVGLLFFAGLVPAALRYTGLVPLALRGMGCVNKHRLHWCFGLLGLRA
jgi:hypothetical protein